MARWPNEPGHRAAAHSSESLAAITRLAGLAVGYWKNVADISKHWQVDRKFKPAMKAAARAKITQGWNRALGRAKAWEEKAG